MSRKKGVIALFLTTSLALSACGGGKEAGGHDKATAGEEQDVKYSGPTLPGMKPKPAWVSHGMTTTASLGYGSAVALVIGHHGYQVIVLDAATGKLLQRHPLSVSEGQLSFGEGPPVRLLRDTVQGRPVAVVRFSEQVPASGTQAQHDRLTDIVLDTSGKQIWRSGPLGGRRRVKTERRNAGPFDSGYSVLHETTEGTRDEEPRGITTFQPITGGTPVRVPSSYFEDDVYDVVGNIAVMTNPGDVLSDGIRGIDLANGGKTVWKAPGTSYIGTFGPNLMVRTDDRIRQIDPATGQRRSDVAVSQIGESFSVSLRESTASVYDSDSRAIIVRNSMIRIIDGDTGRLRWRQEGPARGLEPVTAARGVAFLAIEPEPSPPMPGEPVDRSPTGFVALDDRTGKVLADNLQLTSITTTDGGHTVVGFGGDLYGFHPAKG